MNKIVEKLHTRNAQLPLHPTQIWDKNLNKDIAAANIPDIVKAGLFLWNDDIDKAHRLVQKIPDREGSFWHAILHRREGDFSNSKYWYRHVGRHPVIKKMQKEYPGGDPYTFVDECASVWMKPEDELCRRLERIQGREMTCLYEFVVHKEIG